MERLRAESRRRDDRRRFSGGRRAAWRDDRRAEFSTIGVTFGMTCLGYNAGCDRARGEARGGKPPDAVKRVGKQFAKNTGEICAATVLNEGKTAVSRKSRAVLGFGFLGAAESPGGYRLQLKAVGIRHSKFRVLKN